MNTKWVGLFLTGLFLSIISCGEAKSPEHKIPKRPVKKPKTALELIRKDDCLTCHSISEKSAGPSYIMVAERYESTESTIEKLAQKILDGGGGTWGMGQMVKHQFLKMEEAKTIVKWILDLDISPDSKIASIPLSTVTSVLGDSSFPLGILVKGYSLEKYFQDFQKLKITEDPSLEGEIKIIHLLANSDFLPLKDPFYLSFETEIGIKKAGKYFFRVDNQGYCQLSIDGQFIITNNEWDSEAWIQLEPGKHHLNLEYLSVQEDNKISLEWITLSGDYYVIFEKDM